MSLARDAQERIDELERRLEALEQENHQLIESRAAVMKQLEEKTLDVTGAEAVEFLVRRDGSVVWVNVDGRCLLRVCRIENVVVNDERGNREEIKKKART